MATKNIRPKRTNMKFTTGRKLVIGFGLLALLFCLGVSIFYVRFRDVYRLQHQINKQIMPAVNALVDMQLLLDDVTLALDRLNRNTLADSEVIAVYHSKISQVELNRSFYSATSDQNIWDKTLLDSVGQIQTRINQSVLPYLNEVASVSREYLGEKSSAIKAEMDALTAPGYSSRKELVLLHESLVQVRNLLTQNNEQAAVRLNELNGTLKKLLLFLCSAFVLCMGLIGYFIWRSITQPIGNIRTNLLLMERGILPEKQLSETNDEVGEIASAVNSIVTGLREVSNFSIEIGKRNFDVPFTPLSEGDTLGNSLIKMREELKSALIEEEKRKIEDEHRNWATQGVARFSELLRENFNDLEDFSYRIISNLVSYLNANQGGMFLTSESDEGKPVLTMAACYAYDRKKYVESTFASGEGLVGRCYIERESIFMTDIPKQYMSITSGLGSANPTCLLLVPLMFNNEIYGVVELASFEVLESYQIEFVEKIAESIASTVSVVRINMQTKQLLLQSKQQTEEMLSHEEELRSKMEELKLTQEQSAMREAQLIRELESLRKS